MRYATPIYFQQIKSEFDTATGNTGISMLLEVKRMASVTDTGTQTLQLMYGDIRQGALTIRLQRPYKGEYSRILIGGKFYRVDKTTLGGRVLFVSEVQ